MIQCLSTILNNLFQVVAVVFLLFVCMPGLANGVGIDAHARAVPVALLLAVTGLVRRVVGQMAFLERVRRYVAESAQRGVRPDRSDRA